MKDLGGGWRAGWRQPVCLPATCQSCSSGRSSGRESGEQSSSYPRSSRSAKSPCKPGKQAWTGVAAAGHVRLCAQQGCPQARTPRRPSPNPTSTATQTPRPAHRSTHHEEGLWQIGRVGHVADGGAVVVGGHPADEVILQKVGGQGSRGVGDVGQRRQQGCRGEAGRGGRWAGLPADQSLKDRGAAPPAAALMNVIRVTRVRRPAQHPAWQVEAKCATA